MTTHSKLVLAMSIMLTLGVLMIFAGVDAIAHGDWVSAAWRGSLTGLMFGAAVACAREANSRRRR